jgi:ATP-dependent DNA helicase RecQ
MATCFPQSDASFLAIHGVGRHKLAQYGERFLAVIRAYCAERGLVERSKTVTPTANAHEAVISGSRTEEVGRLFAAGHSVAQIGTMFGVTRGTVVQHLSRCIWAGQRFAPERISELSALNQEEQARVLAEFAALGTERLRPIFETLGETIPYDELHIMRMLALCLEDAPSAAHPGGSE